MEHSTSLFDKFGGTRKMAADMGRPASTVQSWKKEGRIPAKEQPAVLDLAKRLNIGITAEEIIFPCGRIPETAEAA